MKVSYNPALHQLTILNAVDCDAFERDRLARGSDAAKVAVDLFVKLADQFLVSGYDLVRWCCNKLQANQNIFATDYTDKHISVFIRVSLWWT